MGARWAARIAAAAGQMMRDAAGGLVAVVMPDDCRVCERPRLDASRLPVCKDCLSSFWLILDPVCGVCGRPLLPESQAGSTEGRLCALCRRGVYAFDAARSFAAYDPSLMRTVTLLKHEAIRPLAKWFGQKLADVARHSLSGISAQVVVPVPLHPERQRQRGYNQAELLARAVAGQLGLPLETRAIQRQIPRPPKLRLSRHERWETARGAYAALPGGRIDNRRVLLVDDVFTTGATLDACARALRSAGAAQVAAVTVARVTEAWAGALP
jgi:ComF family protein